eukprot:jgi/Chlat1/6503/Chrsp45S05985
MALCGLERPALPPPLLLAGGLFGKEFQPGRELQRRPPHRLLRSPLRRAAAAAGAHRLEVAATVEVQLDPTQASPASLHQLGQAPVYQICVAAAQPLQAPRRVAQQLLSKLALPALLAVAASGLWWVFRKVDAVQEVALQQAKVEIYGSAGLGLPAAEEAQPSEGYEQALARIRQSTMMDRALAFLRARNDARCVVELDRALEQNSICRTPVMSSIYDQQDLYELYRIKLRTSQDGFPSDFGVLLQLRKMLVISDEDAEVIEEEARMADSFGL